LAAVLPTGLCARCRVAVLATVGEAAGCGPDAFALPPAPHRHQPHTVFVACV
jgi:hypothetical protein